MSSILGEPVSDGRAARNVSTVPVLPTEASGGVEYRNPSGIRFLILKIDAEKWQILKVGHSDWQGLLLTSGDLYDFRRSDRFAALSGLGITLAEFFEQLASDSDADRGRPG